MDIRKYLLIKQARLFGGMRAQRQANYGYYYPQQQYYYPQQYYYQQPQQQAQQQPTTSSTTMSASMPRQQPTTSSTTMSASMPRQEPTPDFSNAKVDPSMNTNYSAGFTPNTGSAFKQNNSVYTQGRNALTTSGQAPNALNRNTAMALQNRMGQYQQQQMAANKQKLFNARNPGKTMDAQGHVWSRPKSQPSFNAPVNQHGAQIGSEQDRYDRLNSTPIEQQTPEDHEWYMNNVDKYDRGIGANNTVSPEYSGANIGSIPIRKRTPEQQQKFTNYLFGDY